MAGFRHICSLRSGTLPGRYAVSKHWPVDRSGTGIISPGEFIPILEESRQIYLLNLEIVRQAAALLRKGLDKGREIPGISVNLSRIDFQACDIFEEIEAIRKEYRLGPEHLYLEITESALAAHPYR